MALFCLFFHLSCTETNFFSTVYFLNQCFQHCRNICFYYQKRVNFCIKVISNIKARMRFERICLIVKQIVISKSQLMIACNWSCPYHCCPYVAAKRKNMSVGYVTISRASEKINNAAQFSKFSRKII